MPIKIADRKLISLAGLSWELQRVDKKNGLPMGSPIPGRVPGDVISDLMANGMVEDPYLGRNSEKCGWVNDFDWLYRARFEGRCPPGERRFLRFMGVDYEAWFRLGGILLGSHEGMFSRVVYEITPNMENVNELEVLLVGQKDKPWQKLPAANNPLTLERVRLKTLKAQYSYGWDFAPSLKNAGIWDDVFLHETGPVAIDDLWILPDVNGLIHAEIHLSSRVSGDGEIKWRLEPVGHEGSVLEGTLAAEYISGPQRLPVSLRIENPKYWNPWEMGPGHMYRLSIEAGFAGVPSDSISDTFGFRTIGFESNPGAPPRCDPWTLVVNGKRMFMRGVNWVPMDSLLARITEDRYRDYLTAIRDMGANMIRVWGGGLREKRAFYDICDELGLMVWQEFPLACAFAHRFPRSGKYRKLLFNEVGDIVRQLRNHPSLMLWCGGNEVQISRNSEVFNIIHRQVDALDGTRRFHPISPSRGDSHNWVVWHGKGNLEDYFEDKNPLVSEFGLQALPAIETIEWIFGAQKAWPPDKKSWTHHNIHFGKMDKYADRVPQDGSLGSYIEATQKMQAHILKTAVERWRRMKFRHSGVGIWQFNEPWPTICWSLVDYFGRPKRAYYALQMAMAPLMVAIMHPFRQWRKGMTVPFHVAVVNDLHNEIGECSAIIKLGMKEVQKIGMKIKPNSVTALEDFSLVLDTPPPWTIFVDLVDAEGKELARNEHDLMLYDPKRANPVIREVFHQTWKWMTREG